MELLFGKLFLLVAGILLIGCNKNLAINMVEYYRGRPISKTSVFSGNFRTNAVNAVVLTFGFSFIVSAILPKTTSTYMVTYPTNIWTTLASLSYRVFLEELIFRYWPLFALFIAKLCGFDSHKSRVIMGIVISILFGTLHVFNFDNIDILAALSTIQLTFFGLVLWYLVDTETFFSSYIAHLLYNMTIWILALALK